MSYERISTWKKLQWDPINSGELYAHIYATALTGDMVDVDVGSLFGWSRKWTNALVSSRVFGLWNSQPTKRDGMPRWET